MTVYKLCMIFSSSCTFNSGIPVTEKSIEMVLGSEYNPHSGWVRTNIYCICEDCISYCKHCKFRTISLT